MFSILNLILDKHHVFQARSSEKIRTHFDQEVDLEWEMLVEVWRNWKNIQGRIGVGIEAKTFWGLESIKNYGSSWIRESEFNRSYAPHFW